MGNALLHHCRACREYTLKEACPVCDGPARPNRPAKFSPEDHYGEYRRRLKRLDQSETEAARASPGGDPPAGKPPAR